MDDNNYNQSNIKKPNNETDNFAESIKNKVNYETLLNENEKLNYIIDRYDKILDEYRKKYGDPLKIQVEKQLMNLDVQNEDIFRKKNLLESLPIFQEYERLLIEKTDIINHLLEEKSKLEADNQSLLKENAELESKVKDMENQNEELYKSLEERMKLKEKKPMNKTFSNNINNLNNNEDIKEMPNSGIPNFNANTNPNLAVMYNTMNTNLQKMEKMEFSEKKKYEEQIIRLKSENNDLKSQLFNLQNKFQKEIEEMTKIENELNMKQTIIDRLEIENKAFKGEVNDYKEAYNSLEIRKNNETENMETELRDLRINIDNYKSKNKLLEEQFSKFKVENAHLKQENDSLKFDREYLNKALQETNMFKQNIEEKEKDIDNRVKEIQEKEERLKLEKEQLSVKLKMKEHHVNKLNLEYNNLLKEKMNDYEIINNMTKNKYEDIIKNKDNEIKELKGNILSYKIEKDKYLYDYNLIQSEYDKLYQQFHIENDNYIKKYEDAENKLNNVEGQYLGTINDLKIKNESLEHDNKMMKNELNSLVKKEKNLEEIIKGIERREEDLRRENDDLKKNKDEYSKKNYTCLKENERLHAQFRIRLEKEKEFYDNKTISLENMVEKQKKQLSLLEGKALDMVKKQQLLTEKYKRELQSTISYYENIINGKIPENYSAS